MCFRNILCISWVTAKDLGTEADVPLGIIRYPVHIQDHDRRHSKNSVPWDRMQRKVLHNKQETTLPGHHQLVRLCKLTNSKTP